MQRIREELLTLKEHGNLRNIPSIKTKSDGKIILDDKEFINYASNDYLDISTKSELRNEFLTISTGFMSSASARLLSGTSSEFTELEKTVAALFNKDSALIFNTGYQCNLGVISSLCTKGDIVFSDKLNHASIIDGMKLAEGDFIRYKHLDYDNLEALLQSKRANYKRAIIVSESVFSMDGDVADIDKLVELKNKYNCLLMIDEAHAFLASGGGLAGISENKDVDIITATFGKSLGSFGAFCTANGEIISYLTNKARSFIFSTSIPPIIVEWSNWLLSEKLEFLKQQKAKLEKITSEAHSLIQNTPSKSQIIPIIIGSNDDTLKISEKLKSAGYYIPAIRPPTVPNGTSRLRISLTAGSQIDDIKQILKIIHEF